MTEIKLKQDNVIINIFNFGDFNLGMQNSLSKIGSDWSEGCLQGKISDREETLH